MSNRLSNRLSIAYRNALCYKDNGGPGGTATIQHLCGFALGRLDSYPGAPFRPFPAPMGE